MYHQLYFSMPVESQESFVLPDSSGDLRATNIFFSALHSIFLHRNHKVAKRVHCSEKDRMGEGKVKKQVSVTHDDM